MKGNNLHRNFSLGSDEASLFSKLPDGMSKLGLENTGNGGDFEKEEDPSRSGGSHVRKSSENTDFVFGAGSEKQSAGLASFGSKGSGNSGMSSFVFGSGVKNSVNLNQNPSIGSEGLASMLPDEMSKLNLQNTGDLDSFNGKKKPELVSNCRSGINLSGTEATADFMPVFRSVSESRPMNAGSEKQPTHSGSFDGKLSWNNEAGVRVFENGTKKNGHENLDTCLGLEKESLSKLPDEMRKLDLKNSCNMEDFQKNKPPENVFNVGGNKTGPGSSIDHNPESAKFGSVATVAAGALGSNPANMGLGNSTVDSVSYGSRVGGNLGASNFVFSAGVSKSCNVNQDSTFGLEEVMRSEVHDKMMKMNLSSDSFEKAWKSDTSKLGGSKDITGSFASGAAVPDVTTTQSVKYESAGFTAGSSVHGSNTGKSSISSFNNSKTSELPADQKFSAEGLPKAKEMGRRQATDEDGTFASGTSANAASPFEGNAANSLHDDMGKLKIGSNGEEMAGKAPFEFGFQGGNEDQRSNVSSIPTTPAPGSGFSFMGEPVGLRTPQMEFKTPMHNAANLTKDTLLAGTHPSMRFNAKMGDIRSAKTKKKRGKTRQSASTHQSFPMPFASKESDHQGNLEADSTGAYSPMDYSPYREDSIADQCSSKPSVTSDDSVCFVFDDAPVDTQTSFSGNEQEEVLLSAAQRLSISECNLSEGEVRDDFFKGNAEGSSNAESAFVETQTNDMPRHRETVLGDEVQTLIRADIGSFSSNVEKPASEVRTEFKFLSSLDFCESNFAFKSSAHLQGPLSSAKQNQRRKNRLKSGQNPSISTPNSRVPMSSPLPDLIPHINPSGLPDLVAQQSNSSPFQREDEVKTRNHDEPEARQESTSTAAASIVAQEACEKWRFRGNQAYANGHLTKAEDYYTHGINSVPLKDIPSSCIRPLTLCYSNRAATRMSLRKMREALSDCVEAVSIDPNFLKARVRVANCHLSLGEIGEALKYFRECLQSDKDNSDQKYLIEASEGLQKAQKVAELTGQSTQLLLRRTPGDASQALDMLSEALSISPHSESLLEMKAEALLMMQNYDEVIKLCEQTLSLAEQNCPVIEADSKFEDMGSSNMKSAPARLWRWRLIAKSYFYLGKLENAHELLQKHENLKPAADKSQESLRPFAITVKELLRLKSAGNEAFQAGRHSEAVEYYTSALACNAESRPFTAVLFCNRAAAYQALGQITDASADCSLAIALDPNYLKAISRRATLHEMIRDYGQAANDLSRLISLLEKQMGGNDNLCRRVEKSTADGTDIRRARARLATVEEEARKEMSLNMYLVLGIEPSSSAADIKKAYRKAALRHHPDKAGQSLVRTENIDDKLWRQMVGEVHADADRLFKMIGEAYTILSDPTKRLQYDAEVEMRTCPVKSYNGTPKASSDNYNSHYDKSFNRRQWQARGTSYQRW